MKRILLVFIGLAALGSHAQSPVTQYLPPNGSTYNVLSTGTVPNQSATGANVVWNFTLVNEGMTTFTQQTPTAAQLSTFPNTTTVVHQQGDNGESFLYVAQNAAGNALTGTNANDIALNYSNNAFIGTPTMNYGYAQTDATSGTYAYTTYSGTFSGTVTTNVDAYGTISVNGLGNYPVTRVKVVQNLNLTYFGISAGTATQTTYSYYKSDGLLQFTSSTLAINAPLAGINESISTNLWYYESLGTSEQQLKNVALYPNPTKGALNISSGEFEFITIADMTGKTVFQAANPGTQIDLSNLQTGIYTATLSASKGNVVKKIVKK